jgi:hypothetical protein
MGRRTATAFLLVVVTVGTWWGSASAKDERPAALDAVGLESAVLALEDLPTGWSEDTAPPPLTPEDSGGFCDRPNEAARAQTAGAVASAQVTFTDGSADGASVTETAFSFPTVKAAKSYMKATRAAIDACPSWKALSDDGAMTRSVAPISFRKVGDETIAVRITGIPDGATTGDSIDQVVVRKGNHAITVMPYAGLASTRPRTRAFVDEAVKSLGRALRAARSADANDS